MHSSTFAPTKGAKYMCHVKCPTTRGWKSISKLRLNKFEHFNSRKIPKASKIGNSEGWALKSPPIIYGIFARVTSCYHLVNMAQQNVCIFLGVSVIQRKPRNGYCQHFNTCKGYHTHMLILHISRMMAGNSILEARLGSVVIIAVPAFSPLWDGLLSMVAFFFPTGPLQKERYPQDWYSLLICFWTISVDGVSDKKAKLALIPAITFVFPTNAVGLVKQHFSRDGPDDHGPGILASLTVLDDRYAKQVMETLQPTHLSRWFVHQEICSGNVSPMELSHMWSAPHINSCKKWRLLENTNAKMHGMRLTHSTGTMASIKSLNEKVSLKASNVSIELFCNSVLVQNTLLWWVESKRLASTEQSWTW